MKVTWAPRHLIFFNYIILCVHFYSMLNNITSSGLSNHELRLKVGVLVMLLGNLDQSMGLRNSTRLIITKMGSYVREGKVILGSNIGKKSLYSQVVIDSSDGMIPAAVSFAMTIRARYSHLNMLGYIIQPVSFYGQLYKC